MEYKKRSGGGNAVRSSAYNGRDVKVDEATGEQFDFSHKARPGDIHLGTFLPAGAGRNFEDAGRLWNAVERAEKRRDAQVAREIVIALPKEFGPDDWVAMARRFVAENITSKGLAAQVDIHGPDEEDRNPHCHLLITTRRVEGDHLAARKARDLDPEVTTKKGKHGTFTTVAGDQWGKVWGELQNLYFKEQGISLRCDETRAVPEQHMGPRGKRGRPTAPAQAARAAALAEDREAWADPARVLDIMTRTQATFRLRDLDRALKARIEDAVERSAMRAQVLAHSELVVMHDPRTGRSLNRFTTQTVLGEERQIITSGSRLSADQRHRPAPSAVGQALDLRMSTEQRSAYHHVLNAGALAALIGRAGTGKTFVAARIVHAYALSGYEVIGLAPTHSVKKDMASSMALARAETLQSELWFVENGRRKWTSKTVIVLDEAAMVSNSNIRRLLDGAAKAGAKVVLLGDDRQLQSIERGGMFRELIERFGSAELTEVRRQQQSWQAKAAEDLAGGRFRDALKSYDAHGNVRWSDTKAQALTALVTKWAADSAARPSATRFVIAATNADVHEINSKIRSVRADRGEIGLDVMLPSEGSVKAFAVADRIQIIATDKTRGLFNGECGTVDYIDDTIIHMTLDSGKKTVIDTREFDQYRHGYAGTIYKSQGRSIDETYMLHGKQIRAESLYVGLTRQRHDCNYFVGRDEAPTFDRLVQQCSREDGRRAAISYDTPRVGREVETALQLIGRATLDEARKLQIEDRIIAYAEARQEAAERWQEVSAGGGAPESHESYSAFLRAQQARHDAVRDLVSDEASRLVGAHVVGPAAISADHMMASGTRTRAEAEVGAWLHSRELGLRDDTWTETLAGMCREYEEHGDWHPVEAHMSSAPSVAQIADELGKISTENRSLAQKLLAEVERRRQVEQARLVAEAQARAASQGHGHGHGHSM